MDEEETKSCPNCKREIPAVNFTIHSVHCARNIKVCPVCKEPVPGPELDDHHEKMHKLLPCKQCGESVCGTDLEDHIRDSCGSTVKSCRYCELELPRRELPAHEGYCGVRTEQCPECHEYVMLKYQQLHRDSNHGFIRLDDDPAPPKKEPPKLNRPLSNYNLNRPNTAPNNGLVLRPNIAPSNGPEQRPTTAPNDGSSRRPTSVFDDFNRASNSIENFHRQILTCNEKPPLTLANPRLSGSPSTLNFGPDLSTNANTRQISSAGSSNGPDVLQDASRIRIAANFDTPLSLNSTATSLSNAQPTSSNRASSSNTNRDSSNPNRQTSNSSKRQNVSSPRNATLHNPSPNLPGGSSLIGERSSSNQRDWIVVKPDLSNTIIGPVSNTSQNAFNIRNKKSQSPLRATTPPNDPFNIRLPALHPSQNWRSNNPSNRQDPFNLRDPLLTSQSSNLASGSYYQPTTPNREDSSIANPNRSNPEASSSNVRKSPNGPSASSYNRPTNLEIPENKKKNVNSEVNATSSHVNAPSSQVNGSSNSGLEASPWNMRKEAAPASVARTNGVKKRTNDQPQINMDTGATKKVEKDLGAVSRGAVKKRPAPQPPRSPRRDRAYYSAMQRQQTEERERREQNEYNLAHGLPPVLNAAQKLEKLRKMDRLHNRDFSPPRRPRSPQPPPPAYHGHVLGRDTDDHTRQHFKNMKPMSPTQFMRRFSSMQVSPSEPGDRFPEIKSSLRELRRGLNEVIAPYNANNNNAANNNNGRVRTPSPYEEGGVQLPCEFCGTLIAADDLVQHQTGCRPDLARLSVGSRRSPRPGSRSPSPRLSSRSSRSPRTPQDPVIPCEFCAQSLPVYAIIEHQKRCIRGKN